MKKITILLFALFLISALQVRAEESNSGGGRGDAGSVSGAKAASRSAVTTNHSSTVSAFKPVVINMNRGSSGGHNRNFPTRQTQQVHAPKNNQPAQQQPSYGQLNWNSQVATRPVQHTNVRGTAVGQTFQRPSVQNYTRAGVRASVAVHHHAYTQGYVRKRLQKMGVSSEPDLITNRAEIIHTDRAHSVIKFPQKGPDHLVIKASIVSPRHFNDAIVRDHMMIADSPEWQARADRFNATENQVGHHYWHNDGGITYCHYLDNSGYDWYGWYLGDQYFWTRNFNGRWWWYDADFDRWCFWNNGFWWWQDPYHVADLYCYNDANYIPCNSANDQVVVTSTDKTNLQSYASADGTKVVKIDPDTQDAFLYDQTNPPAFDPVYLASGVQSVKFSDTSNGRPMEIVLTLNDGSFDMFDAQGNAYGPGAFDADQAASSNAPPAGPAYESAPPSNPPANN